MGKAKLEAANLTKSLNEALILAALRSGPLHGYELALDIAKELREGAIVEVEIGLPLDQDRAGEVIEDVEIGAPMGSRSASPSG